MGWTYSNKPKSESIAEFFRKRFHTDNDEVSYKMLDCSVVHRHEAYIAYEKIDKITNERIVFGVVSLLGYDTKSYYNFGYKDMDESMGPDYHNCPEKILNLLTPTTNENSLEWRKLCKGTITKRKELKFKVNDIVEFETPISFKDGKILSKLKVVKLKPLVFENPDMNTWGKYKCGRKILINHGARIAI